MLYLTPGWTALLVLVLTAPLRLAAQVLPAVQPASSFEHLGSRTGLSHNATHAILQDRQGFLWIGTDDGLNRYDGYEFVVYRHHPLDTTSLVHNAVYALLEDRHGTLWVGTEGGLNRFDRRQGRFFRCRLGASSVAKITALLEDRNGDLWVGTDGRGLFRYDQQAARSVGCRPGRRVPSGLADDRVGGLLEARDGTLWIATARRDGALQLHRYDGAGRFERIEGMPEGLLSSDTWNVNTLFEDKAGRIWIGHAGGVTAFDPTTGHFAPVGGTEAIGGSTAFLDDERGTRWLGTWYGLYRHDATKDRFERVELGPYPKQHLASHIRKLYEDHAGALWVATLNGLFRLDPQPLPFRHLGHDPTAIGTQAVAPIMSIWPDGGEGLWLGTFGEGLMRADLHAGRITPYRPAYGNACTGLVWAIHEASSMPGVLWMGGALALNGRQTSLCSLNRRTGTFTAYAIPSSTAGQRLVSDVNAFHEDRKGQLWMATGVGLYRIDPATRAITPAARPHGAPPDHEAFTMLAPARQGGFWTGGSIRRLYRFDAATERYQHYPLPLRGAEDRDGAILAIHEDRRGVIWVGSHLGLVRFEPETGTVRLYTHREGLPGSAVYAILEDDDGRLWLSTNRGLARFDDRRPEGHKLRVYDSGDGLTNMEFNRRAFLKRADGTFFFGGIDGVTAFRPAAVRGNPCLPPVVLTHIQKARRDTTIGVNPYGLDRLMLSHRDYTFSIEFAALNFTNPQRNQYAYMLEGFDEDWVEAGTRRRAQYTNIPPGNYVFRVRGANNDGIWNEEGVALPLTIIPPFWATWWFRSLVILMVLAVLIAAVRAASTRKLRRQVQALEVHRQLQDERERISRDLHDHVGAQLSNIISGLELARLSAGVDDDRRRGQYLSTLEEDAQLMMEQLRETIWALHLDAVSVEALGTQVQRFLRRRLRYREHPTAQCTVTGDAARTLSPVQALNLFRIIQEAINNTLKHAGAAHLYVTLHAPNQGPLEVTVSDDGVFRPPAGGDGLTGFGLAGMQHRAHILDADLELCTDNGTTVRVRM